MNHSRPNADGSIETRSLNWEVNAQADRAKLRENSGLGQDEKQGHRIFQQNRRFRQEKFHYQIPDLHKTPRGIRIPLM